MHSSLAVISLAFTVGLSDITLCLDDNTDSELPVDFARSTATGTAYVCKLSNCKNFVVQANRMAPQKTYEFDVAMTCDGCSGAVERVLGKKSGIENVKIDLPSKKVFVTSTLSWEEILDYIKKTGKAASFVGVQE